MTSQSGYLAALAALPYRGEFAQQRPGVFSALALPPSRMPSRDRLRPLKSWRYVAAFGPELLLCAAVVRIGPARQAFWAVWDRIASQLYEQTTLGGGGVTLELGRLRVLHRDVQLDLTLEEQPGIETIARSARSYAWTRKQGGVCVSGTVALHGQVRAWDGRGVIDDTAGYYERHTRWHWCAGIGSTADRRPVAWNLVSGVNDPPRSSERSVWVDGAVHEPPPVSFAPDLSSVGELCFEAEALRQRRENLVLIRSSYRQPFGTFRGSLPGCAGGDAIALEQGYGVMEEHDVWW